MEFQALYQTRMHGDTMHRPRQGIAEAMSHTSLTSSGAFAAASRNCLFTVEKPLDISGENLSFPVKNYRNDYFCTPSIIADRQLSRDQFISGFT
jgi:hypothetical protein